MKCGCRPHRRREVRIYKDTASCYWVVVRGRRTYSRHRRQATAIRVGIRAARRHGVDLVTHGLDGRIRSKDSYGNETRRRDTEH